MSLKKFKWTLPAEWPEESWDACKEKAGEISRLANRNTSAPVGITYRDLRSGGKRVIRVGPRGAAAIPVELGTRRLRARKPVKRALDQVREA